MDIFNQHLQHLVKLARIPGWRAYAWHRAKEMSSEPLFSGMDVALKEAMEAATSTPGE